MHAYLKYDPTQPYSIRLIDLILPQALELCLLWIVVINMCYINPLWHCMDIWNCRYLEFYQGPMTVYLPLYSTILSVSFFYEVPLESIYNPHIIDITTISFYAVSASPCQCLIRPVQKPKVSWFFGFFFHWFLNYTRGRALRRETSKIHRVGRSLYDFKLTKGNTSFIFSNRWYQYDRLGIELPHVALVKISNG